LDGISAHVYPLRTPQQAIRRFHADLADDVVLRLEAFPQRKRGRPAQWQSEYGDYLTALAPEPTRGAMRAGPLYIMRKGLEEWLPDVAIGTTFCGN
jgi:hypothetical protein